MLFKTKWAFIYLSLLLIGCSSYTQQIQNDLQHVTSDCTPVGQAGLPIGVYIYGDVVGPDFNWKKLQEEIEKESFDWTNAQDFVGSIIRDLEIIQLGSERVGIDCTQECSRVACAFIESIKNNNKEGCYSLPTKVEVTLISGGKYVQGKNISLDYQNMCLAYHLITKKFSNASFCASLKEHIPKDESMGSALSTKDYCYIYILQNSQVKKIIV